MKFSIRIKVIALGVILSVIASGTAIIFSHIQLRKSGEDREIETLNSWLANVEYDYTNQETGFTYYKELENIYTYMQQIYNVDPTADEEFEKEMDEKYKNYESNTSSNAQQTSKDAYGAVLNYDEAAQSDAEYTERRGHYKTEYRWVYPIDGIGFYYMTDEERLFRETYKDLVYSLKDAKVATLSEWVYIVFFDETRQKMIYLADDMSYIANLPAGVQYHLPGSFSKNYTSLPTKKGNDKYYSFEHDGLTTMCYPIANIDDPSQIIVYYMLEYNFDDVNAQVDSIIGIEFITFSIVTVLLIAFYAVAAHLVLVRNVLKLTNASSLFTDKLKNNDDLRIEDPSIKTRDELNVLSNTIVKMEEEIIDYIDVIKRETANKEKLNAELNVASKIQLEALPSRNYNDKNVRITSYINTAKEVGGDFYDYFYLNDGRMVIIISDVSGKGVPAALFMMRGKEIIKANIQTDSNLEKAVFTANNDLIKNNSENLFITTFVGIIDFKNGTLEYLNAGHEKPYIISKDKITKLDGTSNFVLGGEPDFIYHGEKINFTIGERIFLFTDGLNESINDTREEFGYGRVEQTLFDNRELNNEEIINKMNNNLHDFVKDVEAFDDITMMVVEPKKDHLNFTYQEKDYSIIDKTVDDFNNTFSYLDKKIKGEVGIILDEMLNNYVSYIKADELYINVDFIIEKDQLVITFITNGDKFDPTGMKDKYLETYEDDLPLGGFGMSIVKNLSSKIEYKFKDNRNILKIWKNI